LRPFSANGEFLPTLVGVRRLAVKGAAVTVLSSGLGLAVQVVATVVLARLLKPSDFGVVTMVTTFSLLLVNFGLNGFTEAIAQREEINRDLVSNIFWLNVGGGFVLTLAFAAAAPLLARFYHDPLVAPIVYGISLTILITSFSVQHLALLKRAMRFSVVSGNDIVSRVVSVATSVVLAKLGWGCWALVAGLVAQALSLTVGAWILCPWIPSLPRRTAGTAQMVRYALNVYGRFSVNYFARNTDNLLVGWRFNSQALGFYKKAYDLFALSAGQLTAPLTIVAVAALSRYSRDLGQYRRYFLNSLAVLAFVGMALSADLTLIGKDLIRLLLGPGWEESGRIFVFFGPGIGAMLLYGTHGWIHLSIGRADRWFRWGIFEFAFTAALFLIALPHGPVGIAIAWTASFWILCLPSLWYAGKPIQLEVGPVLGVIWRYLLAAAGAAILSVGLVNRFAKYGEFGVPATSFQALIRILTTSCVFGLTYLGIVVLLHWGISPLKQVWRLLQEIMPGKRRDPSQIVQTPVL
jgi:O-antigen/teichoic acid export membrane protein